MESSLFYRILIKPETIINKTYPPLMGERVQLRHSRLVAGLTLQTFGSPIQQYF
jgi:hypothetical protein